MARPARVSEPGIGLAGIEGGSRGPGSAALAVGAVTATWTVAPGALASLPPLPGHSVGAVVGEDERLLEPDGVGGGIAGRQRLALDLVEPAFVIEHRDRGAAAVLAQDAQLAAEHPADASRDVDLDLAALGQRLDRVVDHRAFLEASARQV